MSAVRRYRRCVAEELERLASPAQVEDLGSGSRSARLEAIAEVLPPAEGACKRANPRIIDPDAATAELAPLRLNTGAAVEGHATLDSQVDLAARILLPCFR